MPEGPTTERRYLHQIALELVYRTLPGQFGGFLVIALRCVVMESMVGTRIGIGFIRGTGF
jgi:hypothetical protein